ncbi:MAG TPA: hypothetical protein VM536_10335 [Chloroflexia bacterium]|nr:hypothetical protein [Chloroflexia bacterium]
MVKCPHCDNTFDEALWKTQELGLSDVRMVIVYCPHCKTVLSIFNLDIGFTSLNQIADTLSAVSGRLGAITGGMRQSPAP